MARVLVTGGAGFIGSHIVDELLAAGHEVSVVDTLQGRRVAQLPPAVPLYRVSILDAALSDVIAEVAPECVIHQAAQVSVASSVADPVRDAQVNVIGSIRLFEACRRHGVRKVIYASSAAVYGEPQSLPIGEDHPVAPLSPYGISKHTVEHYLDVYRRLYGLEYTVLRYSNVYGPRQDAHGEGGVVAIFTHRIVHGLAVTIDGSGEQTRDLIYVGDVARANLLALEAGDGQILNVSRGVETSVNQLLKAIEEVVGRRADVVYGPPRSGDIVRSVLDNRRAREVLGWEPRVDLVEGLSAVVAFERAALR